MDQAAPADTVETILADATRELASSEARLAQLAERALTLASAYEQEQAQLRRFLEEFGLEQSLYESTPGRREGSGPLFDFDAMRRGQQELTEQLTRAGGLRNDLQAALQMIRSGKDLFAVDRARRGPQDTADVRLQQAMYAAREDERRRLAREIHDGPAQVLANAIYAVEIAEQVAKRTPDQVADELARVRVLLREGVAEIRRFMFDLMPAMLQDQGLAPTVRRHVAEFNRFFGKDVSLTIAEPLPPLTVDQELCLFRIVQEALQNFRKHAGVDEAAIELGQVGPRLQLTVADLGRGFRTDAVVTRPGSGAGLTGMRERAKLIGAEFTVDSAPSQGTMIRLSVPLRGTTGSLGGAAATG